MMIGSVVPGWLGYSCVLLLAVPSSPFKMSVDTFLSGFQIVSTIEFTINTREGPIKTDLIRFVR